MTDQRRQTNTQPPSGAQILRAVEAFAYIIEQEKYKPSSRQDAEVIAAAREGLYSLTGSRNVEAARKRASAF